MSANQFHPQQLNPQQLAALQQQAMLDHHNNNPELIQQSLKYQNYIGEMMSQVDAPIDPDVIRAAQMCKKQTVMPFKFDPQSLSATFKWSPEDARAIFQVPAMNRPGVLVGDPKDVAIVGISSALSSHNFSCDFGLTVNHPLGLVRNDVYHPKIGGCIGIIHQFCSDNRNAPIKMWKCDNDDMVIKAARSRAYFGNTGNLRANVQSVEFPIFKRADPAAIGSGVQTPEYLVQKKYPVVHCTDNIWKTFAAHPEYFVDERFKPENFPTLPGEGQDLKILSDVIVDRVCTAIESAQKNSAVVHPLDCTFTLKPTDPETFKRELEGANGTSRPVECQVEIQYYWTNPASLIVK